MLTGIGSRGKYNGLAKNTMSSLDHAPGEEPDSHDEPADGPPWELSRLPPAEAEELRAAWQSYTQVIAGLEEEDVAALAAPPRAAN
jgi:hypothetical protein